MYRSQVNKILILLFILSVQLLSQNQTISFRDGLDAYGGTFDTYIDNANPNTSYGSSYALSWDSDPSIYTTFIRFDNMFASQGGPIPNNSYIVSATLTYYVFDSGNDAEVSEVLSTWDNSLTWNQFDFVNDIGSFIGTAGSGTASVYESIDVTSSVSSWSSNPSSNHGWIFQFTGTDGSDVYSSEWTTVNQRPELTVIYSSDFPPDQPSLIAPNDNSTGVALSPSLTVHVTDPDNDILQVKYFARALSTSVGSDFTIIGVPDTQYYTNNVDHNQYFYDQMNWIVANKDALNIVYTSQLGDCSANIDYDPEWQVVNTAWTIVEDPVTTGLVDGMPYGINIGNTDGTSKFNQYFGVSRFQGRAYYGGHYGSTNDNHYDFFSGGGMDFIVVNFEYDTTPNQSVLDWGDALLKAYSNRHAIVVSHYIIDKDDAPDPNAFGVQGQIIYDNLKDNPNLFLMLCGHIPGEGRRSDDYNGNTILTLLADYQHYSNGGNGFLRIMEFRPSEGKIYVSTYSPSLDQFETDSNSEFVLDYYMGSENFTEIATLNNVSSGSTVSYVWPALSPETEYEWYVEVSDGSGTTTSPVWSFTTGVDDGSLPVFISSLTANRTENGIYLEWVVESELENAGFIIERSVESENGPFLEIASYVYRDELIGRGNASDAKIYSFVDNDFLNGYTYFYRIADISIRGEQTYHDIIMVTPESVILDFSLEQNYPNPFNSVTSFNFSLARATFVTVYIFDIRGRVIQTILNEYKASGKYHITFDASNLASGIYYYQLKTNDFYSAKKFILTK